MRIIRLIYTIQAYILVNLARLFLAMAFSPLLTLFTFVMMAVAIYWII